MQIVPLTWELAVSSSFRELALKHINMQPDKVTWPSPDNLYYKWEGTYAGHMLAGGFINGFVVLDSSSLVQGYALVEVEKQLFTGVRVLSVLAIVLNDKLRKTVWAGKLIKRIEDFAKERLCSYIHWSCTGGTPGLNTFLKHPDKYKPIMQTFLQTL